MNVLNLPAAWPLELVVARHSESLAWLRRVPPAFRVTVYDKSGQPEESLEPLPQPRPVRGVAAGARQRILLPNVGREAHTYLHHIDTRLSSADDSLAEASVFCQGRPFDHAFDFHPTLRALAEGSLALGPWLWLGHTIDTDTPDGALFGAWSKSTGEHGLDLDGFHHALLGQPNGLDGLGGHYCFVLGGQFAAGRGLLERRGATFWRRALEMSVGWPEAAHCFERMWDRVLGAPGPSEALMGGRSTVHLKPMRG